MLIEKAADKMTVIDLMKPLVSNMENLVDAFVQRLYLVKVFVLQK